MINTDLWNALSRVISDGNFNSIIKDHIFIKHKKPGYDDIEDVYKCINCNCGLYITDNSYPLDYTNTIYYIPNFDEDFIINAISDEKKVLSCEENIIKNIIE